MISLRHFIFVFAVIASGPLRAATLRDELAPLIDSSCVDCHDASTETNLDLTSLGTDLTDDSTQRQWEQIFDRVWTGEMPPASEDRPPTEIRSAALTTLKHSLAEASLAKQKSGRVPARRLTKLELRYTLQDLFLIQGDVTNGIPDESESGSFDTVGASQRISAVHLESYLAAADEALDLAIRLDHNPYRDFGDKADDDFGFLETWHDKPLNLGGSITRKLNYGSGVVLFADVDYLTQFVASVPSPGRYRLTAKVAAYQSTEPVTAKWIVKNQSGGAKLAKTVDLLPGEPTTILVETTMKPGDIPYLTFDNRNAKNDSVFIAGGSQVFQGAGLAILSQSAEGPLNQSWPPPSTMHLLDGLEISEILGCQDGPFEVIATANPIDDIRRIVSRLAPSIFRRPVSETELEQFVSLASPALDAGRDITDALRIPLRSMLSSPQFLLLGGRSGQLDDHALASRLSYFLWRSMPDPALLQLADQGQLRDPTVLAQQVDRMLADPKADRFVKDFVGQWLRLHQINATSPDESLYPEFEELLAAAIPKETQWFFADLIRRNLSADNLIDSDFTFVNRRLAQHYGIDGVDGQHFRRVALPDDSPRGGILTQAAVLKTTANGTTTSPVTRGNFVLTNFLGTPPAAPPASVGSIEPDTRGKTTIREILSAHRDNESCNQCHREIDPPGFALESFDPIGGFRTHYRASGGEQTFGDFTTKLPPKQGPPVDPSGVTTDGTPFRDIRQYRQHLMQNRRAVVRNFISQLIVFSTGGEIAFADRDVVKEITDATEADGFRVRDIIHAIVQSRLFDEK
ncbi:DUF1592 domain-containing protein [Planctomycetes bacterium K23_9]|uniref:Planctomycete cytochrome C n=1 Tax=Stieleria marina TaxID=1930275 RepID=A0A517NVR8_9BACT|nr:hypothetical protein K239x_32130 [Planctomycetes bacterium K23_9]